MANHSQYSDSACADNPPKSDNWQRIGDLIALAVENGDLPGARLGLDHLERLLTDDEASE